MCFSYSIKSRCEKHAYSQNKVDWALRDGVEKGLHSPLRLGTEMVGLAHLLRPQVRRAIAPGEVVAERVEGWQTIAGLAFYHIRLSERSYVGGQKNWRITKYVELGVVDINVE